MGGLGTEQVESPCAEGVAGECVGRDEKGGDLKGTCLVLCEGVAGGAKKNQPVRCWLERLGVRGGERRRRCATSHSHA